MKQRILDKVEESFKKAEMFYGRSFSRPDNIIFKMTGTTAGHCNYSRRELMFQISIAEKAGDDFINDTPAHEVAHYIERELYGTVYSDSGRRIMHGRRWKDIMRYVMNQDPNRCHNFDVSHVKRVRNTFDYCCVNGHTHTLSSVIHNRMVSGKKNYRCKCGGRLSLKVLPPQEKIKELELRIAKLKEHHV